MFLLYLNNRPTNNIYACCFDVEKRVSNFFSCGTLMLKKSFYAWFRQIFGSGYSFGFILSRTYDANYVGSH